MVDDATLAAWSRAFIGLHVAAALLLVCSFYAPRLARAALGIGFALAGLVNIALAVGIVDPWPSMDVGDGPGALHPTLVTLLAWPVAFWQLACAVSLLGSGTAHAGAFGAMLFLVLVAPFTSSIAFPATLVIGAAALLVADHAARER